MCLGIPSRLLSVDDGPGVIGRSGISVDANGTERPVDLTLLPDCKVGDYVIVHSGYAVSALSEKEALEVVELFDSLGAL